MPIPFQESLVFNWGSFASQPAKAVAFWYQDQPAAPLEQREMVYTLTGPFHLAMIDALAPGTPLPDQALPWPEMDAFPRQSWRKTAQQGFVDLCHIHRRYLWPVPYSSGWITSSICTIADSRLWAARASDIIIRLGCDDPIRLYLNGVLIFSDAGRTQPDPFRVFKLPATLNTGVNMLRVVVGNTPNFNWLWNGFSLVIESDLPETDLAYLV